jgi:hypothetical protein
MTRPSDREESRSRSGGCCHPISGRRQPRDRVRQNDRLRNTGDVTVLFDIRFLTELCAKTRGRSHRRPALERAYTVSMLFQPPLRQTERFLRRCPPCSNMTLNLVPDYAATRRNRVPRGGHLTGGIGDGTQDTTDCYTRSRARVGPWLAPPSQKDRRGLHPDRDRHIDDAPGSATDTSTRPATTRGHVPKPHLERCDHREALLESVNVRTAKAEPGWQVHAYTQHLANTAR